MMETACDFVLSHYREILVSARSLGFRFLQVGDALELPVSGKLMVLRHDVDFSVKDAHRMALLEGDLEIRSTYCVLLHSHTYHVGNIETLRLLREISAMGHEIALHYDINFFEDAGLDPSEALLREVQYLGSLVKCQIRSVAQHRPARDGSFISVPAELVDAYCPRLTEQMTYISDSRRNWRAGCVHKCLPEIKQLQLLIHPEWWEPDSAKTRRSTIARLVQQQHQEVAEAMEDYAASMDASSNSKPPKTR